MRSRRDLELTRFGGHGVMTRLPVTDRWCQVGVPDEDRGSRVVAYEEGRTRSPDWRIACCYVGKGHLHQGAAAAALSGVLDLIAGLGGRRRNLSPRLWFGTRGVPVQRALSTYERLRFVRDPKIGKHRWVVT
jgi:hypothetical protein